MNKKAAQLQLEILEEAIKAICLSRAIAKDYYQVVAKLEGVTAEEVRSRIDQLYKNELASLSSRLNLPSTPQSEVS